MRDYEEQEYSVTKAKTNKLYCSSCKKKIKKGETVIFDLNVDEYGNRSMENVYGICCGRNLMRQIEDDEILSEVMGHGQS